MEYLAGVLLPGLGLIWRKDKAFFLGVSEGLLLEQMDTYINRINGYDCPLDLKKMMLRVLVRLTHGSV